MPVREVLFLRHEKQFSAGIKGIAADNVKSEALSFWV
jgi:hypothetical protein